MWRWFSSWLYLFFAARIVLAQDDGSSASVGLVVFFLVVVFVLLGALIGWAVVRYRRNRAVSVDIIERSAKRRKPAPLIGGTADIELKTEIPAPRQPAPSQPKPQQQQQQQQQYSGDDFPGPMPEPQPQYDAPVGDLFRGGVTIIDGDDMHESEEETTFETAPPPAPITTRGGKLTFRDSASGDLARAPLYAGGRVDMDALVTNIVADVQQLSVWDGKAESLDAFIQQRLPAYGVGLSLADAAALRDRVIGQLKSVREATFSAYYPRNAYAERKHGLYVYAAVQTEDVQAEVKADVSRFKLELGGDVPRPRVAKQTHDIPTGTRITVTPESDELEFEPASLTKRWRGRWTQFAFDFYPSAAIANDEAFVRVSVQIEGIEIAHIKAGIEIHPADHAPTEPEPTPAALTDNPLLAQKLIAQEITPYQRIFVSYSRKDTRIARQYKLAQMALGNDVFLDVDNLRSGENWQAGLARAIDEADIFQLFWSQNSAASQYCRYEWEYALQTRCSDLACEGFIRPVYWEKPLPDVPDTLGLLNFKYVPFVAEAIAADGGQAQPTYIIGDVTGGNVIIGGTADIHGDANVDT